MTSSDVEEEEMIKQLADFLLSPEENPPPQRLLEGEGLAVQTAVLEQCLAFLSTNIREERRNSNTRKKSFLHYTGRKNNAAVSREEIQTLEKNSILACKVAFTLHSAQKKAAGTNLDVSQETSSLSQSIFSKLK